jgi:hypothetical protein
MVRRLQSSDIHTDKPNRQMQKMRRRLTISRARALQRLEDHSDGETATHRDNSPHQLTFPTVSSRAGDAEVAESIDPGYDTASPTVRPRMISDTIPIADEDRNAPNNLSQSDRCRLALFDNAVARKQIAEDTWCMLQPINPSLRPWDWDKGVDSTNAPWSSIECQYSAHDFEHGAAHVDTKTVFCSARHTEHVFNFSPPTFIAIGLELLTKTEYNTIILSKTISSAIKGDHVLMYHKKNSKLPIYVGTTRVATFAISHTRVMQ